MLDDAILERTRRYDLLFRLGVSDPPKVGYLSLDEIDYKTVHEAYQLLNKKYLGIDIEDIKSYSTFLTMEEIKAKHVKRRNSCKAGNQLKSEPEPNLAQNTLANGISSLMVQDTTSSNFSKRRNSCKAKLGTNNDNNTESENKVSQSKVDSRRKGSNR